MMTQRKTTMRTRQCLMLFLQNTRRIPRGQLATNLRMPRLLYTLLIAASIPTRLRLHSTRAMCRITRRPCHLPCSHLTRTTTRYPRLSVPRLHHPRSTHHLPLARNLQHMRNFKIPSPQLHQARTRSLVPPEVALRLLLLLWVHKQTVKITRLPRPC